MDRLDPRPTPRYVLAAFALGLVAIAVGGVGLLLDVAVDSSMTGPGLWTDFDLELLGAVLSVGALVGRQRHEAAADVAPDSSPAAPQPVFLTRPLLETLLERAREAEPDPVSIGLAVTRAEELSGADELPADAPVFTHLYLPTRSNSVSFVFGVDLQTPPGRTQGQFVAHPRSALRVTKRDDLREVVIVAVPPWDADSVAAFDRRGRRRPLRIVDATPPDESLPSRDQ